MTDWFTMIEDNLAVPLETAVLGVRVMIERIDLTESDQLVAICKRGSDRQRLDLLDLLDLPLPDPAPAGAEWIEAYRHGSGAVGSGARLLLLDVCLRQVA